MPPSLLRRGSGGWLTCPMRCRPDRTGPTRFGLSAFPLAFWGFHSAGHDLGGDGDDLLKVFLGEIIEGHEGLVGFVTQKPAEHVVDRRFAALCPSMISPRKTLS